MILSSIWHVSKHFAIHNFIALLRAGLGTATTHFTHSSRDHCLPTHHFYAGDKKKKKFPFCNPLAKPPFWLSRELPHKSQNHLNHFPCPFPLHQPPSPDLPALYSLFIKHLLTAVTWLAKHVLYSYIYKIKNTEITCFGCSFSHIPVHFWNTWMISRGSPKTLWVSELRSSSGDSLEQALPTNKLSNHLMQAVEKSRVICFFFLNKRQWLWRSNCKNSATTLLS